jgi:hypothetical protein
MAVKAQAWLSANEQRRRIRRGVGIVAARASVLGRFMHDAGFLDGLLNIPVTGKTQVLPGVRQEIPYLAGVRIVAIDAVPLSHHLVDAFGSVRQQVVVALQADLPGIGGQKSSMVGCVGVMALGTLALRDRSMDMAELQLFLERLVACQTKLSISTGFEFVGVLGEGT